MKKQRPYRIQITTKTIHNENVEVDLNTKNERRDDTVRSCILQIDAEVITRPLARLGSERDRCST